MALVPRDGNVVFFLLACMSILDKGRASLFLFCMAHSFHIAVLAGDGIGPEVMAATLEVLCVLQRRYALRLELTEALVGGAAIEQFATPLPPSTLAICEQSDAILFGSVGGPQWTHLPPDEQPERGALLPLRSHFGLFANLRPGICFPALSQTSPLDDRIVEGGFDVLVVRELTGGIYFGKPKGREVLDHDVLAYDTMRYTRSEIERIAHIAFQSAQKRGGSVCSVDKANVLASSMLWRETVDTIGKSYPDVRLSHLYVDNAAMQLIRDPKCFDVLLTSNLFGDILSDEIAILTGSLGMLPSASLGKQTTQAMRFGLYEPSGGSAPDIANQNKANPIAQILSLSMLLSYSLGQQDAANALQKAVEETINAGYRTQDIFTGKENERCVTTTQMASHIADAIV